MCRFQITHRARRSIRRLCVGFCVLGTGFHLFAEQEAPWLDDPSASSAALQREQFEKDLAADELNRSAHHYDMVDTMYASTPEEVIQQGILVCPVPTPGQPSGKVSQSTRRVDNRTLDSAFERSRPDQNSPPSSNDLYSTQLGEVAKSRLEQQHPNALGGLEGHRMEHSAPHFASSNFAGFETEPLHVPLIFAGANTTFESLVRLTNQSDFAGNVSIVAVDDLGQRKDPVSIQLNANETKQFNSRDLELGNSAAGLLRGIGLGIGDWRLELYSDLALDVSSFVATPDGLLVSMHDTVLKDDNAYHLPTFFTSTTTDRVGLLRLTNPGSAFTEIYLESRDDQGTVNGSVSIQLAPGTSTLLSEADLVKGRVELHGRLAPTSETRQLWIQSDAPIHVMNLTQSESSHITNISTTHVVPTAESITIPLASLSGGDPNGSNLLRLANRSAQTGHVELSIQDAGLYELASVKLAIDAFAVIELDATDFTNEDSVLGLGNRLAYEANVVQVSSDVDLAIGTYHLAHDGFLSPSISVDLPAGIYQTQPFIGWNAHHSPLDYWLLTNPSQASVEVQLNALLANETVANDALRFELRAGESRRVTYSDLGLNSNWLNNLSDVDRLTLHLEIESSSSLVVQHKIESLDGRTANLALSSLSQAQASAVPLSTSTAEIEDFFNKNIYQQIVQRRCINCHVAGGPSGFTRLVFVRTGDATADEATNLQVFRNFIANVDNGGQRILNKMRGIGHGGGVQFRSNSSEYRNMETFLQKLGEESDEPELTVDNLLEHVALESDRRTLWKAALIFAGRKPHDQEYDLLKQENGLRTAVRGVMQGDGFHEFLIRSTNDRLLTERDDRLLDEFRVHYPEYVNKHYDLRLAAGETGNYREYGTWFRRVNFAVRREGLELIAHVIENDLPYTEILTADYVMANPYSAEAYGAETEFTDQTDAFEFQVSDIESYYRRCKDLSFTRTDIGYIIKDRGSCPTDLPIAGLLTNKVFLQRYPTTPTNRNRARSRWTYYHFLDLDIENSASRTTDPVALADTNNPTLKNSACTVCHSTLDPVAGAFQDYGEEGNYRDERGGWDALDYNYKVSLTLPRLDVNADTYETREVVSVTEQLTDGNTEVQLRVVYDDGRRWTEIGIDNVVLKNNEGDEIARYEIEDLAHIENDNCGSDLLNANSEAYAYKLTGRRECSLVLDVEIPRDGEYTLEAQVWKVAQSPEAEGEAAYLVMVPEAFYRDQDTWYRDMRSPGFGSMLAPEDQSSVTWLAQQIVQDDRFAESTVKFWWPAITGTEVPDLPTNRDLPGYENLLIGVAAQHIGVENLAAGFKSGFADGEPFNLRDLLTEIVLTPWFRGESIQESADDSVRSALQNFGIKRLLTPEELSQKTAALTGIQWGRHRDERQYRWPEHYTSSTLDNEYAFRLLYGGIDSDGITERARDMNAVMAGVAKTHAVEVSCPVIMRELYLLEEDKRYLFDGLDKWVSPSYEFGNTYPISAASVDEPQTITLSGQLPNGDATLLLAFLNDYHNPAQSMDRNVYVEQIQIKDRNGEIVQTYELDSDTVSILTAANCNKNEHGRLTMLCDGIIEIPISVPTQGMYSVELVIWGDQAGDEEPMVFVSANSSPENSTGSRLIKSKLVELYDRLLGTELAVDSPELADRYNFLVDSWERNKGLVNDFNSSRACAHWTDYLLLDGVVDEPVVEVFQEYNGTFYRRNERAWNELNQTVDWSDPSGIATTWVTVLTSFLLDYDYLHF